MKDFCLLVDAIGDIGSRIECSEDNVGRRDRTVFVIFGAPGADDLLDIKMKAIDNCREAGLSIVLVVTLVKGINDNQIGDIIRFAKDNFDIVRCVNVQPVSICGRIDEAEREKMRITIPDFMNEVEEQTKGTIKVEDFYPVPTVVPISRAVAALKNRDYVEFTTHPHCGMATYVFIEKDKMIPINRYVNVDKFINTMQKIYEEAKKGNTKRAKLHLLGLLRHIKFGLLRKYLLPIVKSGSYDSLGDLHRKMLLI